MDQITGWHHHRHGTCQPLACVPIINKHSGNQAPGAINRVWLQYDIFAQYQFAHGRFGSLVESLAFFRRINKSDTDLDLRFGEDPHFYRIPLHDARDWSRTRGM